MYIILLFVSIILATVKSSIYKVYAKTNEPDQNGIFKFNALSYGVAALVALAFGVEKSLTTATLICAFFYALIVCSLQGLSVYAMKIGSMSKTSLMVLYGMIIPTVAGPIFWKEPFGIWQGIGVFLILVSMWMLREKETSSVSVNKKWTFVALILFVLSGMAGVMEKIHQSTDGRGEKTMFILLAYLIMFLISVCGIFLTRKTSKKEGSAKSLTVIGGLSGIIVSFYALTNLTLAGNLDSMIYYPVANGGALIFTILTSMLIFKEKCTKQQMAGFVLGLLSIIILSLPI